MGHRVVVYRTRWCGYCVLAERLLRKKGIAFDDVDVTGDAQARAMLADRSGSHTVPQVFIDDRAVGGWVELHALYRSGELDRLMATPP